MSIHFCVAAAEEWETAMQVRPPPVVEGGYFVARARRWRKVFCATARLNVSKLLGILGKRGLFGWIHGVGRRGTEEVEQEVESEEMEQKAG
jgi:hypothetical protein